MKTLISYFIQFIRTRFYLVLDTQDIKPCSVDVSFDIALEKIMQLLLPQSLLIERHY